MLTQNEINNQVWKACDTFRGTIDATQYKDYILTMLFLKYISDVLQEKRKAYHEKYEGNQTRVDRAMRLERFQVPEEATFKYIYKRKNGPIASNKRKTTGWRTTRKSYPISANSSTSPSKPSKRPTAINSLAYFATSISPANLTSVKLRTATAVCAISSMISTPSIYGPTTWRVTM